MSQTNPLECTWCRTTTHTFYCHDCTTLQCSSCVTRRIITQFNCSKCNTQTPSEICASCGSECSSNQIEVDSCSNCRGVELSPPDEILQNLPTTYFTTVSKIKDVSQPIVEIHNNFDIFIALVRQCRIARLKAFPQIEDRLSRCAKGIEQINKRAIDQLSRVKREALFELFNISYFKNIDITQYRSAERLINNLGDSIEQTIELVNAWCSQVKVELENMYTMSHPLRKHYLLLQKLADHIPFRYHSIAGVVPANMVKLKQGRGRERGKMYMVFTSDELIFLPDRLERDTAVNFYEFSYTAIQQVNGKNSSIKGRQLEIKFDGGEAVIFAPPQVLRGIQHYFNLIDSDEPMLIGSEKVILKIEADLPDKNQVSRASDKFIEVFRERLYGKNSVTDPSPTISMNELRKQFKDLKRSSQELDDMVRDRKINLEDYRDYRNEINDALSRLRQQFNQRGGHFFEKSNFRKRDLNRFFDDDDDLPFPGLP